MQHQHRFEHLQNALLTTKKLFNFACSTDMFDFNEVLQLYS